MFYLQLAAKNVFRDPKRSLTLGINYFFVSLLLFLVFSVTNGVKSNITANIISSSAGHLTISGESVVKGRTYQGISGYQKIDSLVRTMYPEIRINTRYSLYSPVYYQGISKRLSFTGILPQLDSTLRGQITVPDSDWIAFVNNPSAVLVPKSVTSYFGVSKMDELLIAARSRFGAFNTGTLQLSGQYATSNYFLREFVLCHFDFLQSLDLADKTTASRMFLYFPSLVDLNDKREILISLLSKNGYSARKPDSNEDALNAIAAASPRADPGDSSADSKKLTIATVDEVTGIVSTVVAAINGAGLLLAGVMLFIIAVSIFINMRMTINERMREIGTLRALGAESRDITALFVFENVALCFVFILAGITTGFIAIYAAGTLITIPAGDGTLGLFLNNGHLVLKPSFGTTFFICTSLLALTALFSFFPARYGSKIPAVEALNSTH